MAMQDGNCKAGCAIVVQTCFLYVMGACGVGPLAPGTTDRTQILPLTNLLRMT
jgi:hypothetical protein